MKKIMFNDKYGLTDAVLRGRKTQTRRIVPRSVIEKYFMLEDPPIIDNARYEVGDVVAVAQKYEDIFDKSNCINPYDWDDEMPKQSRWTNKMFVRADLMPHRIRITDVRVERLQDISDGDCIKEGIEWGHTARMFYVNYNQQTGSRIWLGSTNREAYASLIDKISGKGTWESNPYVFVYDFELV